MIRCRIDRKKVAVDAKRKEKLFCIGGYVHVSEKNKIEIIVDGMYPYSVKYYHDRRQKKITFTVEVILPIQTEKIILLIKKDSQVKKMAVKVKRAEVEEWTMEQRLLLCMMSGNVRRQVFYDMDEAVYLPSLNQWVFKGWLVSAHKTSRICHLPQEEEQTLKFYRRRDIESLEVMDNPEIITGFTLICSPGDMLHLSIGDREHGYNQIHVPTASLLLYYHIRMTQEDKDAGRRRYGEKGILYKEKMPETMFWEKQWNSSAYRFVKKPGLPCNGNKKISIVVAVNNIRWMEEMIQDSAGWGYDNYEIIFSGENLEKRKAEGRYRVVFCCGNKEEKRFAGFQETSGDYVMFLDQEDKLEKEYLGYVGGLLDEDQKAAFVYSDYDLCYDGEYILRVRRLYDVDAENPSLFWNGLIFRKEIADGMTSLQMVRESLLKGKSIYNDEVLLHYACVPDTWNEKKEMPIAFYLPQYHITEENNKWWGEGFTEWTNVRTGKPLYKGHHQPRIPGELGYYDLTEDADTQKKQVELAKEYGVYGFCFYYYWFEGKRLLRKPLDQYLERKDLDLPYCICWANENWTRRWDGQEKDILMQQVHNADTDEAFIRDVIPMFRDPRYIRIEGKPVLLIYRFGLFEYPAETIERWRRICREEGIGEVQIAVVQAFKEVDNRVYGADFSVEFPPHMTNMMAMETILGEAEDLDERFSGHLYSYKKMVDCLGTVVKREYTLYPGSMLEWDNTARRNYNPDIYMDFTPELFRRWLIRNQFYARLYNPEPVTFINAWNEWAEGTYLEPDEKWGRRNLEMVKEVVALK